MTSVLILPRPGYDVEENYSPISSPEMSVRRCASFDEALETRQLRPGEIHVWLASPRMSGFDRARFLPLLSADERARMDRFQFDQDRDNFLFCRSMLRMLLASYLGTLPAELVFAYSAHGKPSLARTSVRLEFNLSHSDGTLLIATCLGRKLGVDIEKIRHDLHVKEIATRFFSEAENKAIAAMPLTSCYDTFFACWTRKEAFVKARGEGLSLPLRSFDVGVDPADGEVALTTRPNPRTAERWRLWSLKYSPELVAAVAVEVIHGLESGRG